MEDEFNSPHFVAVDFEHATSVKGTVCSVGIATFNKFGTVIDEYYTLIKPPNNKFERNTTNKHRINSEMTKSSPNFADVFPEIKKRLNNRVVVAHGAFHTDKHCLEQAMELSGIYEKLNIEWICTQELCKSSLDIACKAINIELDHHQALSDAIACGKIYAKYLTEGLPLSKIQELKQINQFDKRSKTDDFFPQNLRGDIYKPDFENARNRTNPFYMKKVVITGFPYAEKSKIAEDLKKLGADIDSQVTKRTQILIAGPTAGPAKLEKMRTNIEEGKEARIITFEEFNLMRK
ncbi:MAG TPA: exonuclease domain-containing protein [Bacteroidales bacterium]|nr:exonuclease domain-containing protein [Bacteroidales bacterium]